MTIKINKLVINLQGSSMPRKNEAGAPIKAGTEIEREPKAYFVQESEHVFAVYGRNGVRYNTYSTQAGAEGCVHYLNEGVRHGSI